MAKEKKTFKAGLYAVVVGIVLAVVLGVMAVCAFVTRYTAYSPEKVAVSFVDTIVQTGDGYNAYKNTLVSQNKKLKYGDFIRRAYMVCFVNEKDANGKAVPQADFVGTGSEAEQKAIDEVYNTMYDYYVELLENVGWDDYETFFMSYFSKLREVRKQVYGDDFMNMEYMFGALEANVAAYGDSLTGTERKIASDNKTILREETVGKYQEMFGVEKEVEAENIVDGKKQTVTEKQLKYKLTTQFISSASLEPDEVKAYAEGFRNRIKATAESGEAKADVFGIKDVKEGKKENNAKSNMISAYEKLDCADDITDVKKVSLEIYAGEGDATKLVATQDVYVVALDGVWYVDNTNIDTSALYLAQ